MSGDFDRIPSMLVGDGGNVNSDKPSEHWLCKCFSPFAVWNSYMLFYVVDMQVYYTCCDFVFAQCAGEALVA